MLTDDQFRHLCSFVRRYLEHTAARSEQWGALWVLLEVSGAVGGRGGWRRIAM